MKCEKPDGPDNGSIRPDDQDFFDVDKKIWFSCDRGFELKGKKDLQCRSNGKWSDKIPRCERKFQQTEKILLLLNNKIVQRICDDFIDFIKTPVTLYQPCIYIQAKLFSAKNLLIPNTDSLFPTIKIALMLGTRSGSNVIADSNL